MLPPTEPQLEAKSNMTHRLETQNIAQLALNLSLAFDLYSMTEQWPQIPHYDSHASSHGQTSSFHRYTEGRGQCFHCLVNITNEPHVSLSHHLSVRRTLRMLGLALMQLRQKTQVYRPEMLMREWKETWQGGGRGRVV